MICPICAMDVEGHCLCPATAGRDEASATQEMPEETTVALVRSAGDRCSTGAFLTYHFLTGPGGEQIWIRPGRTLTIGRDSGCDIRLDGGYVSRRHATIVCERGQVVVRDLGSRNGVRVNEQRAHEVTLAPGDCFAIGGYNFVYAAQVMEITPGRDRPTRTPSAIPRERTLLRPA